VESRRWLGRAANSGISAIVAPSGRVVAQTPLFTEAVLTGEIALRRELTPYARRGEWFTWLCVAGLAGVLTQRWRSARR
jgi:apolipoprotein N-acyltransferase